MLKVIELFAGVGGFRVGLEKTPGYEIIWSNQWEPTTKSQPASKIYTARFGSTNHSNEDITKVIENQPNCIPNHDLLVGGFPCQDYSVAWKREYEAILKNTTGIKGTKGVLWWSIYAILENKGIDSPDYLMLENVDRLLKFPTTQRGRDFAIILSSLTDLGYIVEWRVINAAEFGMPQRRKRVYIMAYKSGSSIYDCINNLPHVEDWITTHGVMQNAFPMKADKQKIEQFEIQGSLEDLYDDKITFTSTNRLFKNVGIIKNKTVITYDASPEYYGDFMSLRDVLQDEKDIPPEFYITPSDMERWAYLKGAKNEPRTTRTGIAYQYSEGAVTFPDALDKPSRTIVTVEGGQAPSRFKHVIEVVPGRYRRLTPVELERLNMFPDNHTQEAADTKRAFLMGNALVVGVVEKLGESLYQEYGRQYQATYHTLD